MSRIVTKSGDFRNISEIMQGVFPKKMSIGERLEALRRQKGLSRSELERAAGLKAGKLYDIERGRQRLSGELAVGLSGLLGVPVEQLLAAEAPSGLAEEPAAYSGAPDDPLRRRKDRLKILVEQCDDPDLLDYIQAAVDAMIREERKRRA